MVNTNAGIDHDCEIHNHVFISLEASFVATLRCVLAFIGHGATIIPNTIIGNNSTVGAGTTVVNDVPENTTIVGTKPHTLI